MEELRGKEKGELREGKKCWAAEGNGDGGRNQKGGGLSRGRKRAEGLG